MLTPRPASDPRAAATRASWTRFIVLVAGLTLVFVIIAIVLWPWPYAYFVEQFLLPQYEAAFGFRGGRLAIGSGNEAFTIYGLIIVAPEGVLGRAGARSGDIPVEYHGGIWAFYGALQDVQSGVEGRFEVLAQADWPERSKRREIILAPLARH